MTVRDPFLKRTFFKPFLFVELEDIKKALQNAYWKESEFSFDSDIQDFKVHLEDYEREVIRKTLLAISQIEVGVKTFWAKLGDRFPSAEFIQVGIVAAESEVRHADAYSKLLEVLGLNGDFELLLEEPVIKARVDYLTKYLKGASDSSHEGYTLNLTLFSLFIENVSLFSQFAIIKSFSKERNLLKRVDNVVDATRAEETLHALLGAQIIGYVRDAHPEWFNADFYAKLKRACLKAYDAECNILDWIFSDGELPFLSKASLKEFIKDRFNKSLAMIGGDHVFEIDKDLLKSLRWFEEESHGTVAVDFFAKRSSDYSKFAQAFDEDSLF